MKDISRCIECVLVIIVSHYLDLFTLPVNRMRSAAILYEDATFADPISSLWGIYSDAL